MKAKEKSSVSMAPGESVMSLSQLVTPRVRRLLSLEKRTMKRAGWKQELFSVVMSMAVTVGEMRIGRKPFSSFWL